MAEKQNSKGKRQGTLSGTGVEAHLASMAAVGGSEGKAQKLFLTN